MCWGRSRGFSEFFQRRTKNGDLIKINQTVVSVTPAKRALTAVPKTDDIIIGKVLRITSKHAVVSIQVVGSTPTLDNFQGTIRSQDVRASERDSVMMYKCFRPGDVVRARVISLGDSTTFFLSTAANELGVVFAESACGVAMVPISWKHMVCPKTGVVEERKCAKPDPTLLP